MDLPNLSIIFCSSLKQFDLSSVKMNLLPKKCEKIIQNFIEDLNSIQELSSIGKNALLIKFTILGFILTVSSIFFRILIPFILIFYFIIICGFFYFYHQMKKLSDKIIILQKQYQTPLKRYYSLRPKFTLKIFLFNTFKRKQNNLMFFELRSSNKLHFKISENYGQESQETLSGREDVEIIEKDYLQSKENAKPFKVKYSNNEKTQLKILKENLKKNKTKISNKTDSKQILFRDKINLSQIIQLKN